MVARRIGAVPWATGAVVAVFACDPNITAKCPAAPGTVPPKSCAAGVRPSDDGQIDDFEDGDNQLAKVADRNGYWFTSHDPNGSTIDPTPFKLSDGGMNASQKALHVWGHTAGDSDAWGSLLGANFVGEGVYDASKYAGISFWAKSGDGSSQKIRFKVADVNTHPDGGVCKNCWNHFGSTIELTKDWKEYKIAFVDMKQEGGWGDPFPAITPSKLMAINWSIGPGHGFDMWLDDIQFFECQ